MFQNSICQYLCITSVSIIKHTRLPVQQLQCRFFLDAHMQYHADSLHSLCATCAADRDDEMFPCVRLLSQGHLHCSEDKNGYYRKSGNFAVL